MVIRGKRIRSLDRYLGFLEKGGTFIPGVPITEENGTFLELVGFPPDAVGGDTVLPSGTFGPVSHFNAEGGWEIHRDRPKETAYRMAEWSWTEWHGPYQVEKSDWVDVPYKRYPRTFIPPPSIELTVAVRDGGDRLVISPELKWGESDHELILHSINLFLEIFGECRLYDSRLEDLLKTPVRRLNWRILPQGKMPWPRLQHEISPIVENAPEGNQRMIFDRFQSVNSYQPEFLAVGEGGFQGYIVFGFPDRNLYVLESMYTQNATYVFKDDWENLSRLTKAEILSGNLQHRRLIHLKGWHGELRSVLSGPANKGAAPDANRAPRGRRR